MLEIIIRFPEKEDANKLNYDICSFFQGSKAFQNNDIIVSPVYTNWYKNKQKYFFSITFVDENVDRRVIIEGGEIIVMGIKKLWAFIKDDDQNKDDKNKDLEK